MSQPALEDRICDGAFAGLALWTLAANACVFLGAGLDWLIGIGGGLLAGACLLTFVRREGRRAEGETPRSSPRSKERIRERRSGSSGPSIGSRAACLGAACGAAGFAMAQQLYFFWGLSLAIAIALVLRELPLAPRFPSPRRTMTERGALVALSLFCVTVVLLVHRPDPDDAYYLNLAVAAVDDPAAPMIAGDSLHGIEDLPLTLPIYRVHSIELLAAALSRLTGFEVLTVAHLWLPVCFAALMPLVLARLLRKLVPDRWLWATLITLLYLMTSAENGQAFANFAFVRLQQGKAAMLMVAIPLLIAYGIEFARRPSRAAWLRLAGVQIAAMGLSATALWLAPVVAGLALVTALPLNAWRRGLTGLGASVYVLGMALLLRAETTATFQQAIVQTPELLQHPDALASMAFRSVLGWGPMAYGAMIAWLAGWAFAPTSLLRRMYAVFGLGLSLFFWNPFWADTIATYITSAPTYWRVLWLLPLPIWVGILLSTPLQWRDGARNAGIVTCVLVTGVALTLGPTYQALSVDNQVSLQTPGWKLPEQASEAARAVRDSTEPGDFVLAPEEVATWIPTLSGHPHPLLVRPLYTPILAQALSQEELAERRALTAWVEARVRPPHAARTLSEAIRNMPLSAVVFVSEASEDIELIETLQDGGLARVLRNDSFEVWSRLPETRPSP